MLSDLDFIKQTLINNLYYLRTMNQFCINIYLSFLENNQRYKDIAINFARGIEDLGRRLIKYVDGYLEDVLDEGIFVTKYTLPLERLTEELFDIKIATDLTEEELQLTPGTNQIVTPQIVSELMEINSQAMILATNFIEFCKEIYNDQRKNDLFSYNYPALYRYMIEEIKLYETTLGRLNRKNKVDPTYVIDYQYWFTTSMKDAATFIRGYVDPENTDIFTRANSFVNEFDYLIDEYKNIILSPQSQDALTNKTMRTVDRFRLFLSDVITGVLNDDLTFIVAPIFLDNMYTSANYFKYVLKLDLQGDII